MLQHIFDVQLEKESDTAYHQALQRTIIEELTENKKIVLEQKTTETVQVLMRET